MNCWTDGEGNKFYCLDPINQNYYYDIYSYFLLCEEDESENLLHRIDGPAAIYVKGIYCYVNNGNLHREDGPAYICYSGITEWWLHGKQISCKDNEEFLKIIKMKAFI